MEPADELVGQPESVHADDLDELHLPEELVQDVMGAKKTRPSREVITATQALSFNPSRIPALYSWLHKNPYRTTVPFPG